MGAVLSKGIKVNNTLDVAPPLHEAVSLRSPAKKTWNTHQSIQHKHNTHTRNLTFRAPRANVQLVTPFTPPTLSTKLLHTGGDQVKLLVQALTYCLHELLRC